MRINCPYCGARDSREFTCAGHALALRRPEGQEWSDDWDDYVHNRDNPAGWTEELWHHGPCGTWVVVERNTITHEVRQVQAAAEVAR